MSTLKATHQQTIALHPVGAKRDALRMHLVSAEDRLEADVDVVLEHAGKDVERVRINGRPIGWIHHVAPVYVVLVGGTLSHAVEIAQKHTLDAAIDALVDTVPVDALVAP